jgi:hypothetical protein
VENSTIRGDLEKDGYSQEDKYVYEHERAKLKEIKPSISDDESELICPCCGAATPLDIKASPSPRAKL